ncbi:helix-turn-helix domain-containing protein [Lyngbya sp. PCC 8106]
MRKVAKVRLYPTDDQKQALAKALFETKDYESSRGV